MTIASRSVALYVAIRRFKTRFNFFMMESDLTAHLDKTLSCLIRATKISNQLPTEKSDFVLSQSYQSISKYNKKICINLYDKIRGICNYSQLKINIPSYEIYSTSSFDAADLLENIIDANDYFLDRSKQNLDEALGVSKTKIYTKPKSEIFNSSNIVLLLIKKIKNRPMILRNLLNIEKPQYKFKRFVPNDYEPYRPNLTHKPNALIPLEADTSSIVAIAKAKHGSKIDSNHPYIYEIHMFQPVMELLSTRSLTPPSKLADTPLTYIDTIEGLNRVHSTLYECDAFSFDLEAHGIRSYQGFTCLLQISTKNEDFVIDTIALHDEIHVLNDVFSNPTILKVGHGTEQDIIWLQRDFDIFVVNLFDTGIAAKALQFSKMSLDFLVYKFFNIYLDKTHQLSDWRRRPLTSSMLTYARSDSHYLLPLFEHMVSDLNKIDPTMVLTKSIFERSKKYCVKLYAKPNFEKQNFSGFKNDWRSNIDIQNNFFIELCRWRDQVARIFDESVQSADDIIKQTKSAIDAEFKEVVDEIRPIILKYQEKVKIIHQQEPSWDELKPEPPSNEVAEEKIPENKNAPIEEYHSKIKNFSSEEKFEGFKLYKNINTISDNSENIKTVDLLPKNSLHTDTINKHIVEHVDEKFNKTEVDEIPIIQIPKLPDVKIKSRLRQKKTKKDPIKKSNIISVENDDDKTQFDYSSYKIQDFSKQQKSSNRTQNKIKKFRTRK
ncbi:hypothetical protein HZS_2098 [Henneguya salminicola]|nr:hypothetical protein HZS_2098 [Henneguya salminicola]